MVYQQVFSISWNQSVVFNVDMMQGNRRLQLFENVLHNGLLSALATWADTSQPLSFGEEVYDILHEPEYGAEQRVQEVDDRTEDDVQQVQETPVVAVAAVVTDEQPVEEVEEDVQNAIIVVVTAAVVVGCGRGGGCGDGCGRGGGLGETGAL